MPPSWRAALQPGSLVIAAVSGGSDSTGLALLLHEESCRNSFRLHIVHVNHHLEGCLHEEDAAFAADLASRLGVPFTLLHLHDEELRQRPGVSSSLEARLGDERLRLLKDEARRLGAAAIAFGHTANDAAETFLLMALRGAGPAGLGSMREARWIEEDRLWLLRPLLASTREEVRQGLRAKGQPWREDPMNATEKVNRNKVRHRVLPVLQGLDPEAVRSLARAAAACASASEALRVSAQSLSADAMIARVPGGALMDAAHLATMDPDFLRAVIAEEWRRCAGSGSSAIPTNRVLPPSGALVEDLVRRLLGRQGEEARFGPASGYAAACTAALVLLLHGPTPISLGWATLLRAANLMILIRPDDSVPVLSATQCHTPGRYVILLPEGQGRLEARVLPAGEATEDYDSPPYRACRRAAFDVRSIRRDLWLRPLDGGESLPAGGGGQKTVATLLQEARVPLDARQQVAALADDRGPLWIPGIRRAVSAYVTPRTQLVLVIEWIPEAAPAAAP